MILRISRPLLWCLPFLMATRLLIASPVAVDDAGQVAAAKLSTLPGAAGFDIEQIIPYAAELVIHV